MESVDDLPRVRMRRSPELAPLTSDHHQALLVAIALRKATPEALPAAAERFRGFWQREGDPHFALEEAVFHPRLVDDERWLELVARMQAEHTELRRRAVDFLGQPTPERARLLGEMLHDHVRFEERLLFDVLERRLDPAARAAVGRALAHDSADGDGG